MSKSIYRKTGKKIWVVLSPIIYTLSPILASRLLFWISTGKKLDLEKPESFNEKLMWLKLFWQHPLVSICADKYEVRNYVESKGFTHILPKLYGKYENTNEIEWSILPDKFALKCSHGCGFNVICINKSKIDIPKESKKLQKWLQKRYAFEAAEIQYDSITPRIICEEYIETTAGFLPNDYKIYCFNGEPKLTLVCTERANEVRLKFMDLNWNEMI